MTDERMERVAWAPRCGACGTVLPTPRIIGSSVPPTGAKLRPFHGMAWTCPSCGEELEVGGSTAWVRQEQG